MGLDGEPGDLGCLAATGDADGVDGPLNDASRLIAKEEAKVINNGKSSANSYGDGIQTVRPSKGLVYNRLSAKRVSCVSERCAAL